MLSRWVLLTTAFLFVSVSFFVPAESAASGDYLKSAGCKTEFYLLKDLADAYQEKTGTKLRTAKTGNKKAVNLMLSDSVDFTFTCKPINKLSRKLKLDTGEVGHWQSIPIAKDPIVVVSNTKNGVASLSVKQLTSVFKGETKNWAELGGSNLPISVTYLDPELESGSLLLFKEFTVGAKGSLTPDAKFLAGPTMIGNFVSRTPGGVTFMSLTSYRDGYGDILAIDGVVPSKQSIEDGSYQLSATYYLTLDGKNNAMIENFVAYCMSEEGQQIIARNFIPYSK